jgi:lipoprotein-anchoring transpeptidase ErfK/SrfK
MNRRMILSGLLGLAAVSTFAPAAEASTSNFLEYLKARQKARLANSGKGNTAVSPRNPKGAKPGKVARGPAYGGATVIDYASAEKPGTLIIKTSERALYLILGNGKAKRFLVAVGKEGFQWAGVAKIGMKRENPTWTPPPEMIERSPQYAKWADGMPGGLPFNPLGPRAMYLFNKGGDTGFRIHGTIHPESIGYAASSGCIRMLNREVIELYGITRVGTKVIVI